MAPIRYKTLKPNQACAKTKLSTFNIIDNNANARKIGSDCLRLSLAEAIRADKDVIFEMSPPV